MALLDCGHDSMADAQSPGWTLTSDGRRICHPDRYRERNLTVLEELEPGQRLFSLYMPNLTGLDHPPAGYRRNPPGGRVTLTTYQGLPVLDVKAWRSRISPSCPDGYRFRSLDGRFYGTSPGPGMYAIVRRSKVA